MLITLLCQTVTSGGKMDCLSRMRSEKLDMVWSPLHKLHLLKYWVYSIVDLHHIINILYRMASNIVLY